VRAGISTHRASAVLGSLSEGIVFTVVTAAILAVTSLPYTFAYLSAPSDRVFAGIMLNVPDTAQYLSWAREFSHSLLIENKLTPEAGGALFFNLFWLVVGRLAVGLDVDLAQMLQITRPLAGAFYLGVTYWVVGLYAKENRLQRWVSFLVISLGGGLGWLLVLAKPVIGSGLFPLDLYVSEANTFLTVLAFPFAATATGLLLLIFGLTALAFERESFRLAGLAGGLTLVLGLMHGYDLIVVYAVVGSVALFEAIRRRTWIKSLGLAVVVCAWSAPAAGYVTLLTLESPIWHGVLAQYGNAGVYTPPPAHLLVLLGLPLAAVLAIRDKTPRWEKSQPRELLLRCWLVVGFFLLYIPTDFQIKMLGGWQVPVAILAVRAILEEVVPFVGMRFQLRREHAEMTVGILAVLLVVPVNLYLLGWRFVDLGRHDYPYYLHRDDVAALRWIEANASPSDVVLSSLTIGEYVPSYTRAHAFLAHWAQTLDFYGKRDDVDRYFDAKTDPSFRLSLDSQFGVKYVFYGEAERALGGFDPATAPYLQIVFDSPETQVYRVIAPTARAAR
jgi:hypothetical protein